MEKVKRITIAKGDGIGPEIMNATLKVLKSANVNVEFDEIEVGEKVYLSGNTSGISNDAWETIRNNKIFLKAPITTPQGGGYKSLNVSIRKSLGLYSNVRPCISYDPFITTKHPVMDVVIVRENEEDLYAGIEHQQTDEVVQCLKLISRPGCEKIIRYAFEYAKANNRKKVTCFSKDNIMKQTDGLFHKVFDEISKDYPEIENDHFIVDIGAALLADTPESFDVIVMQNLYGDILSDIAAQISGSVGLGGSSNIGEECAMFEAIHGSAPLIAGKNIANPSGLIHGAIQMLVHIGESKVAEQIHNAWSKTIEDGIHTADIYNEGISKVKVGTIEFADAVIDNLGKLPSNIKKVSYLNEKPFKIPPYVRKKRKDKALKGVDLFIDWIGNSPDKLASLLNVISIDNVELTMITNRGVKVWPNGFDETFCTDHWRCRFKSKDGGDFNKVNIIELLNQAEGNQLDVVKSVDIHTFDCVVSYSLGLVQ